MAHSNITSQYARDVHKISDLKEVAGSTPDRAVWIVDGWRYAYTKGSSVVRASAGSIAWELTLDTPTKAAAKRAIFSDITA